MANNQGVKAAKFLLANDSLAIAINGKANELYYSLQQFDTNSIVVDEVYKDYFIKHHLGKRLFFSLQNSAHILYESVKKTGKPVHELSAIDYGAGLGTLFMLGGMMGFKSFVYNDYLPDWQQTAAAVCNALGIKIDAYVTGDIDAVMNHATQNGIQYDIVASRNVIEHIYSLPAFYSAIYQHNKNAITYATTTANFHNPAMRLLHYRIHATVERGYHLQRVAAIKKINNSLSAPEIHQLAALTRGRAGKDFSEAVHNFLQKKTISPVPYLRSNTCDCATGVWSEHLLTKNEYAAIINDAGFTIDYTPGYWDTHYKNGLMNVMATIFNKIILLLGKQGILLSPFVNVIASN
jgi:2-polyprenyl-3-methyl-5-hydroxy-6-metoxy-1,4-benzoquinol methylase